MQGFFATTATLWLAIVIALPANAPAQPRRGNAPPPAVGVVEAQMQDVTRTETFVGRVGAQSRVDLIARITGFLDRQVFTDGADVAADEPLFVIEQAPFAAKVRAAEANLAAAEAQAENAQVQLARVEQLAKRGNIPQATVDERRADFRVAKADVAQKKAALEDAKITYSYTTIHSPISGRIGKAMVKVGNLVSPQTGVLATVVSQDPMYVTFTASERQYLNFRRQTAAEASTSDDQLDLVTLGLRLSDGIDYDKQGRLDFVDVQVDNTTDTVTLRGTFPNPEGLLIDGQFVVVVAKAKTPQSALVVPRSAVGIDQRGAFVLTVGEQNKVVQKPITMGEQFGSDVVVREGLKTGEQVITQGLTKVRPGMVVNPTPAQQPKATSTGAAAKGRTKQGASSSEAGSPMPSKEQ